MKKTLITAALAFVSLFASAQSTGFTFRLMTMNIKEGGQMALFKSGPFAECIAKYDPDVIVLQEVDYRTLRNGNVDFLTSLADGLNMFPYYAKSFTYQGGGFGVAVISKYPFYRAGKAISSPDGAKEPRAAGWVYVELPDGNIVRVVSVHLSVEDESMRVKNISEYNAALFKDDETTPTVMAGDFNALPGSSTLNYAYGRWQNICGELGFTIPASAPNRRLDYVMGAPKGRWVCTKNDIIAEPTLSDHCFIVADLKYMPQ